MKDTKEHNKQSDDKLLAKAREFKKVAGEYWQPIYDQALADKEFVTIRGSQWSVQDKAKRDADGKPTLEINLLNSYARQQANTMRQNRPQAKVVPVDSGADIETAKLLEGLIKDVEEASDFENALDVASTEQVLGGIGYYRIVTDYIDDKSFTQEPRFKAIENPQAVLIDPLSRSLDGSDMCEAMICEWVDKDTLPKDVVGDDWDNDTNHDWQTDKTVCVAEYFYKERIADTLYQLADGTTVLQSELADADFDALVVVNERTTYRTQINWAKLTANKVLEKGVFAGQYIPIFPVYGDVRWIDNKRHIFSLVHYAKDAQRLFNYWKSTEAHILQKNQDEMLIVDDRGIAGYDEWLNPSKNAILRFNATDENGNPIPYPTRLGSAQPPTGILNASENAKALIPDILNMHAPQMGQDVNAQSGRAIGLLQRQADTAQFHFQDNVNKTIRHSARVLVGLFPILYDVEMVRRVVGADGQDEIVRVNAQPQTPDEMDKAVNGVLNDLSIGRFDVRMDTGPSFNTQREQSFALMLQLVQSNPNLFNLVADLMMVNSPLINAKEIAERVKMLIPPQALGKDGIDPEQAKAQIAQLDQLVQKLTADIEMLQGQLNNKELDRQLEMAKIELQVQKDIQVAQINASSRSDVQQLRSVAELIKNGVPPETAPDDWLTQGEGVGDYDPTKMGDEPLFEWGQQPPPEYLAMMGQDMGEMADPNTDDDPMGQLPPEPPPMNAPQEPPVDGGFLMPDELAGVPMDLLQPNPPME